MRNLNEDNPAWMVLSNEERLALSLHYGPEKSTWQAGEIMKKAHYKYLEIKARAEKFLKMFVEHYEIYGGLFPGDIIISPSFRKFLELTIVERKQVSNAIKEIDNNVFFTTASRDDFIVKEMKKLKNSRKTSERNFHNLIMDFDRWNNFRIMPKSIQEPSAFKRRNKNRHRKHLKIMVNMHPFTIKKLIQRYEFIPLAHNTKHIGFMPIMVDVEEGEARVIKIHTINKILVELNRIGLYVFGREDEAEEFKTIILRYYEKQERHCTDGQKFWPKYRKMIKSAINHDPIQNITPSRKYLESALKDMDPNLLNPKKKS